MTIFHSPLGRLQRFNRGNHKSGKEVFGLKLRVKESLLIKFIEESLNWLFDMELVLIIIIFEIVS